MFKLLRYMKPYRWQVLLQVGLIAFQVWTTLLLPALMARIINQGIVTGDLAYIWRTGVEMVLWAVASAAASFCSDFLAARIGTAFARDLRTDFFAKVLSFSVAEMDEFSTASLITRTTNDVQTVQQTMIMSISMLVRAPLMCVIATIQALATAPDMAWIIAVAVAMILVITVTIMSVVIPKFTKIQKLADRITLLTRENLTGLRVIRAFNNEQLEKRKFDRTNRESARLNAWVDIVMSLVNPLITLVFNGVTLGCVWLGITLMTKDFAYLGNMMAFMQYAVQVVMSFIFLTVLFVMLPRAGVSAKRLNEILMTRPRIRWRETTKGQPGEPRVEFRHVDFAYHGADEKVLSDVSFVAKAGETTAFIGSTGSGKSTLINLVPRFFEATSGEVLIDGVAVGDYSEEDLMKRIGYVPQKGRLFAGTVASNILFGVEPTQGGLGVEPARDSSEGSLRAAWPSLTPSEKLAPALRQTMREAARVAQAEEFVGRMEGGYDARIAEGGTNVSGGQRQRLAIARAIAKRPEIYIFDDAFSALDMKTDARLRKELKKITGQAVTLIVAQRISTIKDAEQIVVLDKGRVVGKGRHQELLMKCKVYREIAKSQMTEAEFAREAGDE